MKTLKKAVSMLLVACMAVGCMTIGAFASEVTTSAFGQTTYPTVDGNDADTVYAAASVDVGETVTDSGELVLFSNYGLCTVTDWDKLNGVTNVESNNPSVATAEITYSGSTLNVAITGVSSGTATITVDYCATTKLNGPIYYEEGVANGYIKYTVKVGSGTVTPPVTPDPDPDPDPTPGADGWIAIHNQAELAAIADDMSGNYYLANDIALSGTWTPLGLGDESDEAFTGIFDGQGHTISGMYYSNSDAGNVGLFAINDGTIRNVTLSNPRALAYTTVGAVAGYNTGLIENVHVLSATLKGYEDTSSVNALYNSGRYIGGITGKNGSAGTIRYCSVESSYIQGVRWLGGIAGANLGTMEKCWADDTEINTEMDLDTLAQNGAIVLLNSSKYVYAMAGALTGESGSSSTITDCYAYSCDLRGWEYVGGLVGRLVSGGQMENCYQAEGGILYYARYVYGTSTFEPDYIDLTVGEYSSSGQLSGIYYTYSSQDIGSGTGYTVSSGMLKQQSTFAEYDFDDIWLIDSYTNAGYPYLRLPDVEPIVPDEPDTYTVTFEAVSKPGDIVDLPDDMEVEEGTVIYLTEPTRTNDNGWVYQFQGWECSVDGETYDVGAAYTVNSDVTFTASWKLITVDGDRSWTYLDAMSIMDYLAGNITFTDEQVEVADYNNDGDVTYLDAMAIMDVLAGTETV